MSTKRRKKRAKIDGIGVYLTCVECRTTFTEYVWSPLWCPTCDRLRVERISRQLEQAAERVENIDPVSQ